MKRWLDRQESARTRRGLARELTPRRPGADLLDLASNDYLGLATDPRLEAGFRDGHGEQVVLSGFEVAKPLGEDRERLLDGCRNDDVPVYLGSGRIRHLVSSMDRSITSP